MKSRASYADKMRQANHEAKATVVGLAVVVVAWAALGFGIAGTGLEVFHTPLWVITGTVGTWIVAIIVAAFMSKRVIADVDLDEGEEDEGNVPLSQGEGNVALSAGSASLPSASRLEEGGAHE